MRKESKILDAEVPKKRAKKLDPMKDKYASWEEHVAALQKLVKSLQTKLKKAEEAYANVQRDA